MGAGRALGLPNQFFQGPAAQGQTIQPLSPQQQAAMAAFQGSPAQQMAAQNARNPNLMANALQQMGGGGAQPGGLGGAQALQNMGAVNQGPGTPGAGQMVGGAPGQGPGGQKAGRASGMAPGMQQQIAGLQGGPPPAAPGAPPPAAGAPGAGPGGQKAPGMQRQIAQLPGGPPAAGGPARRPRPGAGMARRPPGR